MTMIWDDDDNAKNKVKKARDLSNMSVDELGEYIDQLKQEITRVEGEITKKKAATDAASQFFKS